MNVLIVEDNPGDQFLLTTQLKSIVTDAKKIRIADDLSTAVAMLTEFNPHIILLDLTLPDCVGIETFEKINQLQPAIPIIILSGIEDAKVAVQAIARGAQDYLLKGDFDERLLSRSMHYSLERKKNLEYVYQGCLIHVGWVLSLIACIMDKVCSLAVTQDFC